MIIRRAEWGARLPAPDCAAPRSLDDVDLAVIHYSDTILPGTLSGGNPRGAGSVEQQVRAIQRFHVEIRGWCDVAYHWLIAPDGAVYEGRALEETGAHTSGHNAGSVGYCLLTDGPVTDPQKLALLARIDADQLELGGPYGDIVPHSALRPTGCPGDTLRAWVAEGLPSPGSTAPEPDGGPLSCAELEPGPPPEGRGLLRLGASGRAVKDLQRLLAAAGAPPEGSKLRNGHWDGVFGPRTEGAVRSVQARHRLTVDGIVGRQTWCALGIR